MTVQDQHLEIICGDDYAANIQLYEGPTGSTPLNLTGVTVLNYRVKKQAKEGYPLLINKTLGGGITIQGSPANGLIRLVIAAADSLPTPPAERLSGRYHHELVVEDGTGLKATAFQGILTVKGTTE